MSAPNPDSEARGVLSLEQSIEHAHDVLHRWANQRGQDAELRHDALAHLVLAAERAVAMEQTLLNIESRTRGEPPTYGPHLTREVHRLAAAVLGLPLDEVSPNDGSERAS